MTAQVIATWKNCYLSVFRFLIRCFSGAYLTCGGLSSLCLRSLRSFDQSA